MRRKAGLSQRDVVSVKREDPGSYRSNVSTGKGKRYGAARRHHP